VKTANWNGGFLSYEDCQKLFSGKHENETELKLKYETTIKKVTNPFITKFIISLVGNPIVGIGENRMWLDTCGYKTTMTKDRWNTFIPPMWGVYQYNTQWYVTFQGLTVSKVFESQKLSFFYSPYIHQWLLRN
jgi:hypothetical protein